MKLVAAAETDDSELVAFEADRQYPKSTVFDRHGYYGYKFVARRLGLLYFEIPKCMSSSLKTTLAIHDFGIPRWAATQLIDCNLRREHYPWSFPSPHETSFGDFYSFTFVRNPWERVVSAYYNTGWHAAIPDAGISFPQFVESLPDRIACDPDDLFNNHYKPVDHFLPMSGGRPMVDFVGRLETAQEDWASVCRAVKLEPLHLPRLNPSVHGDYHAHYTPELRRIVEDLYASDIEVGGYTF